jgi:hypothetical protein
MFRILLDSRNRNDHTTVAAPSFSLTKTITNVRSVRVKNIMLSNSIYNVRDGMNDSLRISIDGGTSYSTVAYAQPGFYTAIDYITNLNTFLKTVSGSSSDCVILNSSNNQLIWSLPIGVVIDGLYSKSKHILGLADIMVYEAFTSSLFLAVPMSVSFVCGTLQSTQIVFAGKPLPGMPFVTMPLKSGFMEMDSYEPSSLFTIPMKGQTMSTLDFRVVDTASGLLLSELLCWSMELEISTS